ncbi:MAG: hypothetical protein P8Q50_03675 [Octadecabacter sp.]|nr:hypothetical protein [Octadecabacter sp.]
MVAKVLGLATGSLVASVAVWVFNDWRYVSDEDLLATALRDHCIPYASAGAMPFEGIGRDVGVYDNVERDARVTEGGAAIVFDDRFTATWGEISELSLRVCTLEGRSTAAEHFSVELDGFADRITPLLAPLGDMGTDAARSHGGVEEGSDFHVVGWFEADKTQDKGNRVVMAMVGSLVASVTVVADLSD